MNQTTTSSQRCAVIKYCKYILLIYETFYISNRICSYTRNLEKEKSRQKRLRIFASSTDETKTIHQRLSLYFETIQGFSYIVALSKLCKIDTKLTKQLFHIFLRSFIINNIETTMDNHLGSCFHHCRRSMVTLPSIKAQTIDASHSTSKKTRTDPPAGGKLWRRFWNIRNNAI